MPIAAASEALVRHLRARLEEADALEGWTAEATTLPEARDRRHLAELAAAPDLPPPTPGDLDRLAELREARFGLEEETSP